jgi:gliding motility-associated-like protein
VYGLDVNGCLDSAYITINVDTTFTGDMPSGFTPNNDGVNDQFRPVGAKFAKMVEFRVYNRWGEEVFSTNSLDKGWDGTFHGVPQDIGTYFYEVIVATPGGQNVTYKGVVTLIR